MSSLGHKAAQWKLGQAVALLVSAVCYVGLAYYTPRHLFGQLLLLFSGAFGAYAYLLRTGLTLRMGLLAAALLRLLWLPALPALSDDYHRFRWDGLLVAAGVNPYLYRPAQLVTPSEAESRATPADAAAQRPNVAPLALTPTAAALTTEFPLLNSPRYYSVYPPMCQAVFGFAAWLAPTSARGVVLLMRLMLLLAEAGTAWLLLALLRAFGQPPTRALWYLLNPLVIVELTGNLHFEGLMLSFFLLALWWLARGRWALSAGVLGLAVGTKLLPVVALPLLIRRLGWRRFLAYGLVLAVVVGLLFVPFLSTELLRNISRSLALYFHNFEFNASVYYLLRAVGYTLTGYNVIGTLGPALALITAGTGFLLAIAERQPTPLTLPRVLLLLLTVYYLLATVVHPWYLTPLVALSVLTPYRYPVVWSGMAVLSYAAYQTTAYTENLWLVGLEYGVMLAVLGWELQNARQRPAACGRKHII